MESSGCDEVGQRWARRPICYNPFSEDNRMQLPVTLYRDEDGWFVVECPVIPGCASQGRTEDEAIANIREAIALCLEVRREQGLPPVIESRTIDVPAVA
jgi:predicted RNase H-like HicB family nuclease